MLAMIYTFILIWALTKLRNGIIILYIISFPLLLLGIMSFAYGNVMLELWPLSETLGKLDTKNNMETQWLFVVVPFFMLGYGLEKGKIREKTWACAEIFLGICMVGYLIEVVVILILNLKRSTTLCLFTYPVIYFLMICAQKHPHLVTKRASKYCAGIASFMYFSHILFISISQNCGLLQTPTYFLTIGISSGIGFLIVKTNNRFGKLFI